MRFAAPAEGSAEYLLKAKADTHGIEVLQNHFDLAERVALAKCLSSTRSEITNMASGLARGYREDISFLTIGISGHVLPRDPSPDYLDRMKAALLRDWQEHAKAFRKALGDTGKIGNQAGKTRWVIVPEIDVIPFDTTPGRKGHLLKTLLNQTTAVVPENEDPNGAFILFHSHALIETRGHDGGRDALRKVLRAKFPGPYRVRADAIWEGGVLSDHLDTLGTYMAKVMSSRSLCSSSWSESLEDEQIEFKDRKSGQRQSTVVHSVKLLDAPFKVSVAHLQAHLVQSGDFVQGNIWSRAGAQKSVTISETSSKSDSESSCVSSTPHDFGAIQCDKSHREAPKQQMPVPKQQVAAALSSNPDDYFDADGRPRFNEPDLSGPIRVARDRGEISIFDYATLINRWQDYNRRVREMAPAKPEPIQQEADRPEEQPSRYPTRAGDYFGFDGRPLFDELELSGPIRAARDRREIPYSVFVEVEFRMKKYKREREQSAVDDQPKPTQLTGAELRARILERVRRSDES